MKKNQLDHDGEKLHKSYKNWLFAILLCTLFLLLVPGMAVYLVDPVFHYHKPIEGLSYPLFNDRYQNDGIARHFSYEGIITGTSMTQNFKTSEAGQEFGAEFVKLCFPGGHFKEINDCLKRAYTSKNEIKYVVRCLDETYFIEDKDTFHEEYDYPLYLTNDNPFDDVNYLFNKFMLSKVVDVLARTKSGYGTTSFDTFGSWAKNATYGKEVVLADAVFTGPGEKKTLTAAEDYMILANIRQNVTDLIKEHGETEFYLYFPPYSIVYWSNLYQNGELEKTLLAEEIVIEELLSCDNVHLFSFHENEDLICDLDNYKDVTHYSDVVSSDILRFMAAGEYELTKENYGAYLQSIRSFFEGYDYEALYQ